MFTLQRYLLKVWETSSCFTVSSCLYLPKVRGAFISDGGCVQGPWLPYRMKQGTWCQHQPQPDLWAHLLHQPGTWVTSCPCVWAAWPWEMQQWPFPGEWTLFLMGVKQLERACPPSHCLVSLCGCHMGSVREKISVTGLPLPWQAILQLGLVGNLHTALPRTGADPTQMAQGKGGRMCLNAKPNSHPPLHVVLHKFYMKRSWEKTLNITLLEKNYFDLSQGALAERTEYISAPSVIHICLSAGFSSKWKRS